jgi:hypothetical protein
MYTDESRRRELRRLLALGLMQVHAWSHGQRSAQAALPALVTEIRAAFVRDLADEQTVRALHARQQGELDALCDWPEDGSTDALADRFDGLARALLTDIAQEERQLFLHHGAPVTDRNRNADTSIGSI